MKNDEEWKMEELYQSAHSMLIFLAFVGGDEVNSDAAMCLRDVDGSTWPTASMGLRETVVGSAARFSQETFNEQTIIE